MIVVDYEKCCFKDGKCVSCGCGGGTCEGCVEVCPTGALERQNTVIFHADKCVECGLCVGACQHGAIKNV